jgi:hypothetical protein
MAQHDYNLANQTGADFRADLNNALAAIVTVNSGASEPSTTFAHQLWVDTSSNVLKIRNAANNAWLTTGVSITASNTFDINAGTVNGITSLSFSSGATVASILDEDNLSSDSATALATQQSIKAYVDSQVTAQDLDISDGSSTIAIDLDSETLSLLGGTGVTSTASGNGVTFAIGQSVGTSDNVVFNQVTGALVGNASTATTLATARTISGVSFDGSANITLDTDDVGEGSSNLYYTDARFDTRLASKTTSNLTEGSNLYYADSRARAAISENSAQLSYNSGTGVLTYTQGDTDTVSEGSSNLYYTDARANSAIDARVTNTFINNLSGVVADTATALATARTIALSGDVAGSVSFDGTSDVTISSTIQANSVALGTDTVGNYVATITGTANKVSVSGSGSETAGVTLSLPDDVQIADSLTVAGNLTVNGDLTYLDTTNLKIEDNLFELNANLTGSPVNDSGMLINRGNQNNGIFMWDESADKFTIGLTTADGTSTGNITLASLGTLVANLEGNVTGTIQTAAQGNITSLGTLTALTVDDITINDSTISDAGDLTLDVAGDILLDADGGDVFFKDGGSTIAIAKMDSSNFTIQTNNNDKDIIFKGYDSDGGGLFTALTLDMSDAGTAIFNHDVKLGDSSKAIFGAGSDLQIFHDGSHSYIKEASTGNLILNANNFRIEDNSTNPYLFATAGAEVTIYHNGNPKLATTSTGIDVTGTATMDGLTLGDNSTSEIPIYFNSSSTDFSVGANGNNFILAQTTGDLDTNQLLTVTSSGNLGLGTSSPSRLLSVVSNAPVFQIADSDQGSTANDGFLLTQDGVNTFIENAENGFMQFRTNATERMRIDSSGNLGINNTSPSSYSGDGNNLVIGTTSGDNGLSIISGTSNSGSIYFGDTQETGSLSRRGQLVYNHSDDSMRVFTASAEKMRIDSSGNLGLGTTNPAAQLDIQKSGNDLLSMTGVISGGTTAVSMRQSRGSLSSPSNSSANGDGSYIQGQIYRDSGYNTCANMGMVTGASTDDGQIRFSTALSGTVAEKMRLDENGRLGLGTSSPATPLHIESTSIPQLRVAYNGSNYQNISYEGSDIYGGSQTFKIAGSEKMRLDSSGNLLVGKTTTAFDTQGIRLEGSNGKIESTRNGNVVMALNRLSSDGTIVEFAKDGTTVGSIGSNSAGGVPVLDISTNTSSGIMRFLTSNTERMRIDAAGNLGLGTSSPTEFGSGFKTLQVTSANTTSGGVFRSTNSDSSIITQLNTNSTGGFVGTTTSHPLVFGIANTERMRIDSSGNLLVGVSSFSDSNGGTQISKGLIKLSADTTSSATKMFFTNANGAVGTITTSGSATAYNTSSDARLKDVTGEARGLEVINELNPVAYNWKADGKADEGLIAQEVLDIVPNAVSGSEEDMYQMDYSKLVVHLVAGMKEQQTQIEELKTQINNLKGE